MATNMTQGNEELELSRPIRIQPHHNKSPSKWPRGKSGENSIRKLTWSTKGIVQLQSYKLTLPQPGMAWIPVPDEEKNQDRCSYGEKVANSTLATHKDIMHMM